MFIDSYSDTLYDFTPSQEMVDTYNQYQIAENQYFSAYQVHVYLMYDRETGKYGMYVLEIDVIEWPYATSFIVNHCKQLGLDFALFYYPQYGFNDATYGF